MKSCNVSYSSNGICKSLHVPFADCDFKFGTSLTDPVWAHAAQADDFVRFPQGDATAMGTRMALFRTGSALYLGCFCQELPENRTHADMSGEESMYQIWSGDMIEIHFGGLDPDPWKLQLCVGIDGNRFDSTGHPECWDAKAFENEDGWGFEAKLPLTLFELSEGGIRFELCRQALKRKEYSVWNPVSKGFHDTENYGELLFFSYDTIAQMRGGMHFTQKELTRQAFEELRQQWEIPADSLVHGPILIHPDSDAMTVVFQSAGNVSAFVECTRMDNPQKETIRFDCNRQNGILQHETLHRVRLTGLVPGGEYLCQPYLLAPSTEKPHPAGAPLHFRIPAKECLAFSFLAFSDLHSDVRTLLKILQTPQAKQADFLLDLGDNLSGGFGMEALNHLLVDPIANLCPKPLALVMGNHEQLGIYANDYCRLFQSPTGRSWYAFRIGAVHFTVLNSGNDHADGINPDFFQNDDMRKKELAFQKEVTTSQEYLSAKFRILAVHIPPFFDEVDFLGLLAPMCQAEIKPHVMLSGHMHDYARLENGRFSESSAPRYLVPGEIPSPFLPFPLLVNAANTALVCNVTPDELRFMLILPSSSGEITQKDTFAIRA